MIDDEDDDHDGGVDLDINQLSITPHPSSEFKIVRSSESKIAIVQCCLLLCYMYTYT